MYSIRHNIEESLPQQKHCGHAAQINGEELSEH